MLLLDCIVIDYIQLLRADIHYQSRANEVGAISKAIKALAMELNIPIIALSQLNRVSEMRQDKVPTMGELREAGDIEQDASIILLMWNIVDDKKGLKVEKNRQGILSTVMRGESTSEEIIVEGIGDGRSKARKLEKTPSEKDRLKAAELIGKRYGLFTDKIETDVDMDLNITIDYGDE